MCVFKCTAGLCLCVSQCGLVLCFAGESNGNKNGSCKMVSDAQRKDTLLFTYKPFLKLLNTPSSCLLHCTKKGNLDSEFMSF